MPPENLSPPEQLVRVMNRIYYGGMTTLSGGNLSILADDGSIWITPSGMDKGGLTPEDIVRVYEDGRIEGQHRPSSELPFHRAIYARRPDVRAILHAHASALVSFSIARKTPDTTIIPQAYLMCGEVGYAPYAMPGTDALGGKIATAFGEGSDTILLENHGVATVGTSLLQAFYRLEMLNNCARIQISGARVGSVAGLRDEQIKQYADYEVALPEFTSPERSAAEADLREHLAHAAQRAHARQLMTSTEGVISVRAGADSFLITPHGHDRTTLDTADLVLVRAEQREVGKQPDRSVLLHAAIYANHPDIHAVMTAQPPYVTGYAVAATRMNTRTIPESYVLLRDIPRLPFGSRFADHKAVVDALSPVRPVLLIENDGILVVGGSILQAFDRLEVADFTARSIMDTASIGALVPIGDQEIEDLETKYFL